MNEAVIGSHHYTQEVQPPAQLVNWLRQSGFLPSRKAPGDYSRCLGPLLESLAWQGDARQLSDALPPEMTHMSLFDLTNIMACLGFEYHRQKMALRDVGEMMVPCLMLTKQADGSERTLVVQQISDRGWLCHSVQEDSLLLIEDGSLQGMTYQFRRLQEPADMAERYARSKTGFTWFRGIFERFNATVWQVVACGFLLNIAGLASPLFVMIVYDRVIGARSYDALPYLTIGVLIAIVMEGVLRFIRLHALAWMSARINAIVSVAIFERLLFLSPSYTERASVPAQLSRLRAFEMVRDFFSGPIFMAMLELPFVLVIMIVIGLIAGPLVWIALIVGMIYVLMLVVMHRKMMFHIHRTSRSQSERQQVAVEVFTRLPMLRLSGVANTMADRFSAASARASMAQFRSGLVAETIEHVTHALAMLAGVATLGFGVQMIWDGELSIGGLVATMILIWRALYPLQTACALLPRVEHIRNAILQVNRLMAIAPERDPNRESQGFIPFTGHIGLSHVGLRYSRLSDPVFVGLTANIHKGELIAITGGNGAGKSSILKLVAGLYMPQAGTVRIDGIDIRQFDPLLLRRNIAYQPQHTDMFSGTIREYLRNTVPLATEDQLRHVLDMAQVLGEIEALPLGLNTRLDAMEHTMPDGLMVRLRLAQLYLAPQSVILCDELPNEVLSDTCGERFRQFLADQKGHRTVLFVTQHRDIISMADKVIWLRNDHAPRIGTPSQAINWMIGEA